MLSRRSLLVAAGAALPACALDVQESDDSMGSGMAPWHMWGGASPLNLVGPMATGLARQQVATVRYGRPENWQFFFRASIANGSIWTLGGNLSVSFTLTAGVGRAVVVIPLFVNFIFTLPAGTLITGPLSKWTAAAQPPVLQDTAPAVLPPFVTAIAGETLNIDAVASTGPIALGVGDNIAIQAECLLAPSTHLRPEWYLHKFPAGEDKGT
jgi:hypothetical protein